jgi:hypothetical protein
MEEVFGKILGNQMPGKWRKQHPSILKVKKQRRIMTILESNARKVPAYLLFISSCYFVSIHYTLSRYKNRRKFSWIHGSEGKKTKKNRMAILESNARKVSAYLLFISPCYFVSIYYTLPRSRPLLIL